MAREVDVKPILRPRVLAAAVHTAVVAGLWSTALLTAQQQWSPPPPVNLRVLPAGIDARTLISTMRGFTRGLGVRCQHCHVYKGDNPDDLATFDFASDEKAAKQTARRMLAMLRAINDEHPKDVGEPRPAGESKVTCYTCHRGETMPLTQRPDR
jgi:hypothetical protein